MDRFTSRDQLSFGYVRDKVLAGAPQFALTMFQDCERRNFVTFVSVSNWGGMVKHSEVV